MTEWKTCELETVCERLSSGKGISAKMIFDNGEYPVYGGNGIRGYTSTSNFKGDCAIIGRQGAYCGNVRYFKGEAYMTEHAVVVCANDNNCTRYLAYLLSTMNLGRLSGQSAQPGLSVKTLGKQEIRIPSKDIQIKISELLGSIDEKIKHNEEINDNLLQQAQSVFMHIFKDNASNVPATIADIALNITDGVHNTVKDDSEGQYLLLSCKNIKGGSLSIGASERKINSETFDKLRRRTKLAKGDILISSVGTVGELLLLNTEPTNYEFQRSVAIVKPNPELVSSAYVYEALVAQKAELINAAHGAVQQCLFISDIAGFPIGIPNSNDLHAFDEIVIPMFDTISANQAENQRLEAIRDTLLPKLMSGELDVSNLDI